VVLIFFCHVGTMAWCRWPSVFQDSVKNTVPHWRMKLPICFPSSCHRPSSMPPLSSCCCRGHRCFFLHCRFKLIVVYCMCPPPSLLPPPLSLSLSSSPPLPLSLLLSLLPPSPSMLQAMPWEEEEVVKMGDKL